LDASALGKLMLILFLVIFTALTVVASTSDPVSKLKELLGQSAAKYSPLFNGHDDEHRVEAEFDVAAMVQLGLDLSPCWLLPEADKRLQCLQNAMTASLTTKDVLELPSGAPSTRTQSPLAVSILSKLIGKDEPDRATIRHWLLDQIVNGDLLRWPSYVTLPLQIILAVSLLKACEPSQDGLRSLMLHHVVLINAPSCAPAIGAIQQLLLDRHNHEYDDRPSENMTPQQTRELTSLVNVLLSQVSDAGVEGKGRQPRVTVQWEQGTSVRLSSLMASINWTDIPPNVLKSPINSDAGSQVTYGVMLGPEQVWLRTLCLLTLPDVLHSVNDEGLVAFLRQFVDFDRQDLLRVVLLPHVLKLHVGEDWTRLHQAFDIILSVPPPSSGQVTRQKNSKKKGSKREVSGQKEPRREVSKPKMPEQVVSEQANGWHVIVKAKKGSSRGLKYWTLYLEKDDLFLDYSHRLLVRGEEDVFLEHHSNDLTEDLPQDSSLPHLPPLCQTQRCYLMVAPDNSILDAFALLIHRYGLGQLVMTASNHVSETTTNDSDAMNTMAVPMSTNNLPTNTSNLPANTKGLPRNKPRQLLGYAQLVILMISNAHREGPILMARRV
jgi:hypothetical protein